MWISELRIKNIKSITDSEWIQLSPKINVLIGKNNSGKSVFVKSIYQLQNQKSLEDSDIRIGERDASIEFRFKNYDHKLVKIQCPYEDNLEGYLKNFHYDIVRIEFNRGIVNVSKEPKIFRKGNSSCLSMPFSDKEPDNYIYPLLSKRKFVNYNVLVSQEIVSKVDDTFTKEDFEEYYPADFDGNKKEIREETDKKKRKKLKESLIEQVIKWAKETPEDAKVKFGKSAGEVIDFISLIDKSLCLVNS